MSFSELLLNESILRALAAKGYTIPTPIQRQAIPHILAGRDLLGCAQTGTGKTAAFALPILHRLTEPNAGAGAAAGGPRGRRPIRTLVLSPTRELAAQIDASFRAYGKHSGQRSAIIYGGVGQNPQVQALRAGVDIVVATPGRLLDLMQQGHVDLRQVEIFVLDEADRMFDMGFIHDIRKIVSRLPAKRQTLLFSATMPTEIRQLADSVLQDPVRVQVAPQSSAAETVEQSMYFVAKRNKPRLLSHLLESLPITRTLVFTRTKHGADKIVRHLDKTGIRAEAIHGNKSQAARERALHRFKGKNAPVLVATDIAARGLDISEISHVINFDVPHIPETYVHRIGRTGRAGASGIAISFCDREERGMVRDIERLLRKSIPIKDDHPEYPASTESNDVETERQPQNARPRFGRGAGGSARPSPSGNGRRRFGGTANGKNHSKKRGASRQGGPVQAGAAAGRETTRTENGDRPAAKGVGKGGKPRYRTAL